MKKARRDYRSNRLHAAEEVCRLLVRTLGPVTDRHLWRDLLAALETWRALAGEAGTKTPDEVARERCRP